MQNVLTVIQVVSAILMIIAILLQSRGVGLSATFGGSSAIHTQRRGADKLLLILTIVFAVIFVGSSVASLLLS